jgi:hypothetical protein
MPTIQNYTTSLHHLHFPSRPQPAACHKPLLPFEKAVARRISKARAAFDQQQMQHFTLIAHRGHQAAAVNTGLCKLLTFAATSE